MKTKWVFISVIGLFSLVVMWFLKTTKKPCSCGDNTKETNTENAHPLDGLGSIMEDLKNQLLNKGVDSKNPCGC